MSHRSDIPVIIEVALNGVTSRDKNPHVPRTPEEVEAEIRDCLGPNTDSVVTVEDNFNVDWWLWAWKFHMSRNRFWRSLKNKLLWPFLAWFARRNEPPTYRKVFIVCKNNSKRPAIAA